MSVAEIHQALLMVQPVAPTMTFDEARVTVGVPRYTAPFTPSYPFPNQ